MLQIPSAQTFCVFPWTTSGNWTHLGTNLRRPRLDLSPLPDPEPSASSRDLVSHGIHVKEFPSACIWKDSQSSHPLRLTWEGTSIMRKFSSLPYTLSPPLAYPGPM